MTICPVEEYCLCSQGTATAQNMTVPVEARIDSDLLEVEYFNFSVRMYSSTSASPRGLFRSRVLKAMAFSLLSLSSFQSQVRAVSEWGAEGEWAVESVPQTFAAPTAAAEGESSTCAHNDHHIT